MVSELTSQITQIGSLCMTFIISLTLVILSIYMIIKAESKDLWIGMLSTIVGIYLPSPVQFSDWITPKKKDPVAVDNKIII